MSNVAAVLAALRVALLAVYRQVRRATGPEPTHARSGRDAAPRMWDQDGQRWATPHDVGPDLQRLLAELDAHLNEYAAADPALYAAFGAGDWDLFGTDDHTTKGD